MSARVPESRIRLVTTPSDPADGECVLYWSTAFRRTRFNFALDRALEWGRKLSQPVVVLEPLRVGYRWASARFHRFVIDGMRDQRERYAGTPVTYFPYVEPKEGAGSGLLRALGEHASVVVTDDFPCFFHPRMIAAGGRQLSEIGVPLEAVDSNGLLPLDAVDKAFPTAYAFRRMLQKTLREHLAEFPEMDPVPKSSKFGPFEIPSSILKKWPAAPDALLAGDAAALAELPIDASIAPTGERGGERAALRVLDRFVEERLDRYGDDRNVPDQRGTSELSPQLHFGHISSHEICRRLLEACDWTEDDLSDQTNGKRSGWWGAPEAVESFFDELITWRELSFNGARHMKNHKKFESLPDWAQKTLDEHEGDAREYTYSLEEFERSETHDELWNAAQRQLVREGRIHNYLRMLWGKKILHWTPNARAALDIMIELNNKYALDGRDPNSYSGIFWTLGRYDRAWGPERDIFGKVRYMTSANTRRKTKVNEYIQQFSPTGSLF